MGTTPLKTLAPAKTAYNTRLAPVRFDAADDNGQKRLSIFFKIPYTKKDIRVQNVPRPLGLQKVHWGGRFVQK